MFTQRKLSTQDFPVFSQVRWKRPVYKQRADHSIRQIQIQAKSNIQLPNAERTTGKKEGKKRIADSMCKWISLISHLIVRTWIGLSCNSIKLMCCVDVFLWRLFYTFCCNFGTTTAGENSGCFYNICKTRQHWAPVTKKGHWDYITVTLLPLFLYFNFLQQEHHRLSRTLLPK